MVCSRGLLLLFVLVACSSTTLDDVTPDIAGASGAGAGGAAIAGAAGPAAMAGMSSVAGAGGRPSSGGSPGLGAGGTGAASVDVCGRAPALAAGRIQMENVCRGVVAVRSGSDNFVSWRLFGYEPDDAAFNVYRDGAKLTASPLRTSTNYLDVGAPPSAKYTVRAVPGDVEQGDSESATTWAESYLDIPLSPPDGYTPGDTSVGDLDGDGHYDLVVKWEQSPQDNSVEGTTGSPKLEAVTLQGVSKWRIDLGRNIREGAHYTQFLVYDLDGDGRAEIA